MTKKLAKLKYLPNNFQIIDDGDYVECAVSGKKIILEESNHAGCSVLKKSLDYQILQMALSI